MLHMAAFNTILNEMYYCYKFSLHTIYNIIFNVYNFEVHYCFHSIIYSYYDIIFAELKMVPNIKSFIVFLFSHVQF